MKILKLMAFPIAIIYGIILFLRNKMYDFGILSSKKFSIPVISVGNLSMGGTGKTPHVEYLIDLLKSNFVLATLSRGYGRKTSGFKLVREQSSSIEVGDEPTQYKSKFPGVIIAIDEKRVKGIKKIQGLFPEVNLILLDDAFQHRAVKTGLSILLSDYNHPFYKDNVVPTGTLREFRSGYKRADIIIITKSPENISALEKEKIIKEVNPEAHQKIYFSHLKYGSLKPLVEVQKKNPLANITDLPGGGKYYFERNDNIILFTGIANPSPMEDYLKGKVNNLIAMTFKDHHEFSPKDLIKLNNTFNRILSGKKIILTTEKDAMRLDHPDLMEILKGLPIFYLPIEIDFQKEEKEEFNKQIKNFISAL